MKGQKYISFQSIFTVIDWWHEPIEGEEFEHQGYLNTFILSPKLLYGLTNKLNLSISGMLGLRAMRWDSSHKSIHHRNESTLSDFNNASGGILGDTKVVLNSYLKAQKQEMDDKKTLLHRSIKILTDREREILQDRKLSNEPKTLEELSKKYKISRERIRQIETKAFEKLQKAMLNATKSENLLPRN